MKAAVIASHGGVDAIEVRELGDPRPGPHEVVVRVAAAGMNHLDIWVRRGGRSALKLPHVLGSDGSGRIAALGKEVHGLKKGDSVIVHPGLACGCCEFCRRGQSTLCHQFGIVGMSRWGTFAQKVALPAGNVYPMPQHLDFVEAAALGLAHLTAWRMLTVSARLRPGETVLIHGIGGGVAMAGLQLAKMMGAEVIATSSSDEKLDAATAIGADYTVNYKQREVPEAVKQITAGRGVDVAFDSVGAATWETNFACVRRGGRIVTCGVTTGASAPTDLRALYWNQISITGSTLGSSEDFRAMLRAIRVAGLRPVIDSVWPLEQVHQATNKMESAKQIGKIVLKIK